MEPGLQVFLSTSSSSEVWSPQTQSPSDEMHSPTQKFPAGSRVCEETRLKHLQLTPHPELRKRRIKPARFGVLGLVLELLVLQ